MTPTGHFWYYIVSVVVYSHLRECAGADPGRHCGGSPCLSHCSLSMHESPLDCPKPVILLLYTHTHTHTVIHTNIDWILSTQIHSQVCQAVPANVQHDTKCKHWTWQTWPQTHTLHNHKQAKTTTNIQNNTKRRRTRDVTTGNTFTHTNTQNYWTPSTCCIAHTCSKTRETAVHGVNTTSGESHFTKSVWMMG